MPAQDGQAEAQGRQLLAQQRGRSGAFFDITDEDLFSAIDLQRPGLEQVRAAVAAGDYDQAYAAWARYWAQRDEPRYYLETAGYADELAEHLPHIKRTIIDRADFIWSPDFQHSTYRPERAGRTFQWVDDTTTDTAYIGFHYWFWAGELGRAYLLSGDAKYPAMFRELVCSWWDALPAMAAKARCGNHDGIGVVWNNGLGSSIRSLAMLDCYVLAKQSPEFTIELHRKILRIFLGHARYMYDQHMRAYSHSNFQASQCCWLGTAAILLPELRNSPKWLDAVLRLTKTRVAQNYDADGGQLEMCPQYHLTGMRDITRLIWLLKRNNMTDRLDDDAFWRKFEKVYDFTLRLAHPTGHGAVINSGVYGTEWQTFMPIGAQLFGSELHAWAAKRFIGADFVPVAKSISTYIQFIDGAWIQTLRDARARQIPEPRFHSDLLRHSGIAVLRDGWHENAFSMVFDFNIKPFGGHPYPGRLSFDLWAHGRALVVNPGSTLSYSMPAYRQWCHTTRGHNTVMVNNADQGRPHTASLLAWHSGERATFAAAATDTYAKAFGVRHERTIVLVHGGYVLVFDRLLGGSEALPVAWQLHSPVALTAQAHGCLAGVDNAVGLLVVPDIDTAADCETVIGRSYSAVPVSYHPGYTPLDAWRDDICYVQLRRTLRPDAAELTYAVLLKPTTQELPDVQLQSLPSDTPSVYTLKARIDGHVDVLKLDYRATEPHFELTRSSTAGATLWQKSCP